MKYFLSCYFLTTILFLIAIHTSNAQNERGKFLLGGQYYLKFSSSTKIQKFTTGATNNYVGKFKSLEIAPQAGYFISKNIPVGVEILYSYNYHRENKNTYNYTSSFSIIPFLRYYLGKTKIKPYLQAGIGPGWKRKVNKAYMGFPEELLSKLFIYEIKGCLGIMLNEHVSFDCGFGYHSSTEYPRLIDGTRASWKIIHNGTVATIGFMIYL